MEAALGAAYELDPENGEGVKVAPQKGDAIVFYNFRNDGSGQVDGLSVHAGVAAPDEKNICTMFFHLKSEEPQAEANDEDQEASAGRHQALQEAYEHFGGFETDER